MFQSTLHSGAMRGLSLVDQRQVGARAAHVEGDDVVEAGVLADQEPADHPAGGARVADAGGHAARGAGGDHPAAGVGHVDLALVSPLAQGVDEAVDVALDHRHQVGVGRDRGGALELADLGEDLGGGGDEGVLSELLEQDLLASAARDRAA